MQINLQGKNMEVTSEIHDYVIEKITTLGKFLKGVEKKGGEVIVRFDVAKTSNHHKQGDIFRADCSIIIDGKEFFSHAEKPDIFEAIDDVKENIFHEINKEKGKKQALFHRGARKVKDLMKGLNGWRK